MRTLNLNKAVTPALFVVPPKGGIMTAAFEGADGTQMACNASITPYSPVDGKPMQVVANRQARVTRSELLSSFMSIGSCSSCGNNIRASASTADAIDLAGGSFHCPMCASEVTANIDYRRLTHGLAQETTAGFDDDDDSDDDDLDDDTSDDAYSDDDDSDDDDSDDEGVSADDIDDDGPEDDADLDDDDEDAPADDSFDDDDVSEEAATTSLRKLLRRGKRRALAAEDPGCTEDSVTADGDDDEFDSAVAALRDEMASFNVSASGDSGDDDVTSDDDYDADDDDADADDDASDDDSDEETARVRRRRILSSAADEDDVDDDVSDADDDIGDDDDDDIGGDDDGDGDEEFDDASVEAAAAAFRPVVTRELRRRGIRTTAEDMPPAGQSAPDDDIDDLHEEARARLRARRTHDGNAYLKGQFARANVDGIDELDDDTVTPGTDDDTLDASGDTPVLIAGTAMVDWSTANVELISLASGDRWVYADGLPVAKLDKSTASETVVAQWDKPVLVEAFVQAARSGLPPETAREFGLKTFRFRVTGGKVLRSTLRRANELATQNAQKEVARQKSRYQQSVKTAFLAAMKGIYPDLKNPLRESLAADLARLSVTEPRSLFDRAVATSGDALVASIFAKADEIAAKPDAARNEAATFAATAAYQSRQGTAEEMTARLSAGSVGVSNTLRVQNPTPTQAVAATSQVASSQGDRVRAALRSIKYK